MDAVNTVCSCLCCQIRMKQRQAASVAARSFIARRRQAEDCMAGHSRFSDASKEDAAILPAVPKYAAGACTGYIAVGNHQPRRLLFRQRQITLRTTLPAPKSSASMPATAYSALIVIFVCLSGLFTERHVMAERRDKAIAVAAPYGVAVRHGLVLYPVEPVMPA